MIIDGKQIAIEIKKDLTKQILDLKAKSITPHLAVVLLGNDPSSHTYVRQKQKVGEEIGVKVTLYQSPNIINKERLKELVDKLNQDTTIQGIIIQRPLPFEIEKEEVDLMVIPQKDVDGFHPQSPFSPPIALAVLKILEWTYNNSNKENTNTFLPWLKSQKILIIGRGETGGKPIAETFKKLNIPITIGHSKTADLKSLCLQSDIIITAVGKKKRTTLRRPSESGNNENTIIQPDMVKSKTILIGVGLHAEGGNLKPDYDQKEIADKVRFYTPVPGGVGPVNVACLFENLLLAVPREENNR